MCYGHVFLEFEVATLDLTILDFSTLSAFILLAFRNSRWLSLNFRNRFLFLEDSNSSQPFRPKKQ